MTVNREDAQRAAEEVFTAFGITRNQIRATLADFLAMADRSQRRGISADMFVPLIGYCMGVFIGSQDCSDKEKLDGFIVLWKLLNYGAAELGTDMEALQSLMQQAIDKEDQADQAPANAVRQPAEGDPA